MARRGLIHCHLRFSESLILKDGTRVFTYYTHQWRNASLSGKFSNGRSAHFRVWVWPSMKCSGSTEWTCSELILILLLRFAQIRPQSMTGHRSNCQLFNYFTEILYELIISSKCLLTYLPTVWKGPVLLPRINLGLIILSFLELLFVWTNFGSSTALDWLSWERFINELEMQWHSGQY